jgi:ligand-binding SRPBCC domain-containing protein
MTSRITAFDPPSYFQDTMVRGAFRSFQHDHFFSEKDDATEMRDVLRFSAPVPIAGQLAELLLRSYLRRFLRERNSFLRQVAEGDDWRKYLNG